MKAFLLIERHSMRWYGEKGEKPEIKGVICVVPVESAEEVAKVVGGEYDLVQFDDGLRPAVRLSRELFSSYSEGILHYQNGPIHLYMGEKDAGTYLFIMEAPLLQPSKVKA